MCVPVGYETWTFYSIAAALTAVYFFILAGILRRARERAIDPTPYQGSIFLIGAGVYGLAGFRVRSSTVAQDLRLFGKTRQHLALLSLGCSVIGVAALVSTLHCHMVPRKAALWFPNHIAIAAL